MHAIRGTVGYDPNTDEAARQAAKQTSRDKHFGISRPLSDEAEATAEALERNVERTQQQRSLASYDRTIAHLDEAVAALDG